jgi:hypothetical protein
VTKLRLYTVKTDKFGDVTIQAENIKDARADARRRFKVKNPECVTAFREYTRCGVCDSKPCCCKESR